jgi:hypothetical protein
MKRALFGVLVAACSSPPPAKEPPAPPPKCASVADHLLELMTPEAKDAPSENLDAMRRLFNDHCRDDQWTPAAQDCVLAAASLQEVGQRCSDKLTPEQTMALGTAIEGARAPAEAGVAPPPPMDANVDAK